MQKKLDNDQIKIEILRHVNDGKSFRQIEEMFGISRSTINRFVLKKTYKDWWKENTKPIAGGEVYDHHTNIKKLSNKRYILTSAQNNTFVHDKFLSSLKVMSDDIGAKLIVGTFSYNTNGFQNLEKGEGEWFDPNLSEYILDEPVELADGLMWCGELNILPTAVNPLSGLHSYTRNNSGIIPHAKVQLESIPTHKNDPVRMLYTTGCVTKRNYIQKKAGQKASFHHVFGALLVEVDDEGDWFVRQLIADSDTGEFYDLDRLYTPNGIIENQRVEAINWGDIHVEKLDHNAAQAAFRSETNMLDVLRPKYQFIHDVLDFEARNHHNLNDPYFKFRMHTKGLETVKDNVQSVANFLGEIESKDTMTVVVESNHDLALKRWLKEADYKSDPVNAIFFLENQLAIYKSIERGQENFNVFAYAVRKLNPNLQNTVFLGRDESFRICDDEGNGIECGCHGHTGNNGGRGSVRAFQVRGSRYNVGHSHSAAIKDGVYYAGVMGKLDMGYNQGGSSWSHSQIVTYPNGKRTIVTFKADKWRAQ